MPARLKFLTARPAWLEGFAQAPRDFAGRPQEDRFTPHARRLLDTPQRRAQSPQRHNLVVFVVSQDVAHAA